MALTRDERTVVGFASAGHFMCHGAKMALPALTLSRPARDLGVSLSDMSLAMVAFGISMGCASLPAGLMADRFGAARVVNLFFWATALGAFLCWSATTYQSFLFANIVLGGAAGLYHPAGLGLLSLTIDKPRRGFAMGLHGMAGPVGMAVTPLLMGLLAAQGDWRTGFAALAVAAGACAIAGHVLRGRGAIYDDVPRRHDTGPAQSVLHTRAVLLVAVVAVNAFMLDGFSAIYGDSVELHGVWMWDLEVVLFAILALGASGQFAGGLIAKGDGRRRRYALVVTVQPILLLGAGFFLGEPLLPFVLMAGFAFANFMTQPLENELLAGFTARTRRGTAYALKFLVGLLVGAPAPFVVARIAETRGFAPAWTTLGTIGLLAVVLAVVFTAVSRRMAIEDVH